jgi:hypothetical protein
MPRGCGGTVGVEESNAADTVEKVHMLQCSHSIGSSAYRVSTLSERVPRFYLEFIMRAINITTITTLTTAALKAGDDLFDSCTELQAEFAGCDKVTVHTTLLPMVVAYYVAKAVKADKPINLTVKEQGSGRLVMTGDASPVSAATKRLNKLVAVITATVQNKTETEIEVPADILAAAAKLWALCAQYEKAGKICASAIATVKAK